MCSKSIQNERVFTKVKINNECIETGGVFTKKEMNKEQSVHFLWNIIY